MEGIFLIVVVVVGFLVSLVATKKVAQTVYNKTGYNGFDLPQKALCAVFFVLLAVGLENGSPLLLASLIPLALLVVMNLKSRSVGYTVLLTVLQLCYAVSWFFFLLLRITLKFALNMDFQGLSVQVDQSNAQFQQQLEADRAAAEKARADELERANAYAQHQGFRDADEAESWGIKTGKPN